MDLTELQAALKAAQGETAQMRKERDDANDAKAKLEADAKAKADEAVKLAADVKALTAQNEKLVAERDAAAKNAAELNDKVLSAEVEALVGVKIDPAEREDFLALRKQNPELFAKFVSQRATKTILDSDPAGMGKEPVPERIDNTSDDVEFDRIANAALNA